MCVLLSLTFHAGSDPRVGLPGAARAPGDVGMGASFTVQRVVAGGLQLFAPDTELDLSWSR